MLWDSWDCPPPLSEKSFFLPYKFIFLKKFLFFAIQNYIFEKSFFLTYKFIFLKKFLFFVIQNYIFEKLSPPPLFGQYGGYDSFPLHTHLSTGVEICAIYVD